MLSEMLRAGRNVPYGPEYEFFKKRKKYLIFSTFKFIYKKIKI